MILQIPGAAHSLSQRPTWWNGFLSPWCCWSHTIFPRLFDFRCSERSGPTSGTEFRGLLGLLPWYGVKELLWSSSLNCIAGATGLPNTSFFNSTSMLNASRILQRWHLTTTSVIVPVAVHSCFLCEDASFQLQDLVRALSAILKRFPLQPFVPDVESSDLPWLTQSCCSNS